MGRGTTIPTTAVEGQRSEIPLAPYVRRGDEPRAEQSSITLKYAIRNAAAPSTVRIGLCVFSAAHCVSSCVHRIHVSDGFVFFFFPPSPPTQAVMKRLGCCRCFLVVVSPEYIPSNKQDVYTKTYED